MAQEIEGTFLRSRNPRPVASELVMKVLRGEGPCDATKWGGGGVGVGVGGRIVLGRGGGLRFRYCQEGV